MGIKIPKTTKYIANVQVLIRGAVEVEVEAKDKNNAAITAEDLVSNNIEHYICYLNPPYCVCENIKEKPFQKQITISKNEEDI